MSLAVISLASCGDDETTPIPVEQIGQPGIISAGDFSTCITNDHGVAFCWGANAFGQVGDGTQQDRAVPVPVSGDHTFYFIQAGNHACAVTQTNVPYCWGEGTSGQLGNGGTASSSVPVAVSGGLTISIDQKNFDVGSASCGFDSALYCWGPNGSGQLGTGNLAGHDTPTLVTGGQELGRVSTGVRTTCAIKLTDDAAYCWGDGARGELGTGSFGQSSLVPVPVQGTLRFVTIGAGGSSSGGTVCGLAVDGSGDKNYCWGANSNGQLGDGTTADRAAPVLVGGGSLNGEIAVGEDHTCLRTGAGTVYCWGAAGTLGNGTSASSSTPVLVSGPLFATITAGARHTCGRTEEGDLLYCWGDNTHGQLGDGTTTRRLSPVKVLGQD